MQKLIMRKIFYEGIVRFSNINAIDIIQPRINIIALDIEDDFNIVKELSSTWLFPTTCLS